MVIAVAFDDARKTQTRREFPEKGGGATQIPFFAFRDTPDLPHASLNQLDPGLRSSAHFHIRDQFQVVVDGKGRLGRHDLAPYGVHFSRAYTPYGPLLSDAEAGLRFFVMRAHRDAGSQRDFSKLKQMPERQPWQITRAVTFPALQTPTASAGSMMEAIPGIKDEKGLAAYAVSMKPNSQASAPDPAHGDGQYVVVVKGSLWHDAKELNAWALVFVSPQDGPLELRAGSAGLEALVLNFPVLETPAPRPSASSRATGELKTWQCALCSFVYDEAKGLPEEGIAAGTRWKDVPETWSCPDCSASKADFQMTEL